MNLSLVYLAKREEREVGSVLLEFTMRRASAKRAGPEFSECGNGKTEKINFALRNRRTLLRSAI
jgi:hypothetical protein